MVMPVLPPVCPRKPSEAGCSGMTANVFTAAADELLRAVSVTTAEPDCTADIQIYKVAAAADITGVSCEEGEVEASVFDRYRTELYKEASYKPYIIAAMIFLAKEKDPQATLKALEKRGIDRFFTK